MFQEDECFLRRQRSAEMGVPIAVCDFLALLLDLAIIILTDKSLLSWLQRSSLASHSWNVENAEVMSIQGRHHVSA